MKSAHTQKKMPGSTKRQIVSRLNKAIQYANNLVSCLKEGPISRVEDRDILESTAYLASLWGALHFEKSRWDSCTRDYSVARVIYATLGAGPRMDLFKDLLSSMIDPSIRYAAYQLRLPRTKAVSEIAVERFPTEESELRIKIEQVDSNAFTASGAAGGDGKTALEDTPSTVSWRKRTVKIEDATIAQAIAVANSKERELTEAHAKKDLDARKLAAAYDDVINARQEAVDATKSALDELMAEGADTSDSRVQSLQLTRTAVNYAVIELRVGRNRVLCGTYGELISGPTQSKQSRRRTKEVTVPIVRHERTGIKLAKLRERMALLDTILQNVDAVRDLSGVAGDSALMEELSGKRAYFRALKYVSTLH